MQGFPPMPRSLLLFYLLLGDRNVFRAPLRLSAVVIFNVEVQEQYQSRDPNAQACQDKLNKLNLLCYDEKLFLINKSN